MKNPSLSIIIANFNGEKYLKTCLDSVMKSTYNKFEVILVDDGSMDKSLEIIKLFQKKDKRIKFYKNSKNLGASASRNKAIKKSKGDIIVFLDNDTKIKKNSLEKLIKPLQRSKDVGAVQALLLDFDNEDLIQMAGGLLIPHVGWLAPFNQWESYKKAKERLYERNIVAISAALAVKREIINKIGGFDEKEAVYTEDLDFCWRVWLAGYRIILVPDSIVYHRSKSVNERRGMRANYRQIYYHLAKNSIRSLMKNYEFKNLLKYLPFSLALNLGRGVVFLFSKSTSSALIGTLQAIFWTVINLSDTLKERSVIQSGRNHSDEEIWDYIFTNESLYAVITKYYIKG